MQNPLRTCTSKKVGYLVVVFLEVVVGDQVPVELEIQHVVLALDVPGHGQVLHVAALLLLVPRVGDLPLVSAVIQPGTDEVGTSLKMLRELASYCEADFLFVVQADLWVASF